MFMRVPPPPSFAGVVTLLKPVDLLYKISLHMACSPAPFGWAKNLSHTSPNLGLASLSGLPQWLVQEG